MKRNIINFIKEYGIGLFISKSIRRLCLKSDSTIATKINTYNEEKEIKILSSIVLNKGLEEENVFERKCSITTEPIWIMWWQGYDQAPEIVKACINSVKKNNLNHEVILITKDNFQKYIDLPAYILKKVSLGYISVTHLSDMIRVLLLYIYGGVWCDATILCDQPINNEVFKSEFYTIKVGATTKEPSHGNWTTFFMSSRPNNMLMKKLVDYHFQFWKEHNEIIDYIMFDYLIRIILQNNNKIKRQVEMVPLNNQNVFKLDSYINTSYDSKTKALIEKLEKNTYLFKLSWKDKFVNNNNSLYHHILNTYL